MEYRDLEDTELGSPGLIKLDVPMNERSQLLEQCLFTVELDWASITVLAKYLQVYKIKKGQVVFYEGSTEMYLCLVVKGRVNIFKQDSSHAQKILGTVGPGRTFGEMSLIDGEPRSATAVAGEESVIMVLPQEQFNLLIEEAPRLAVKVIMNITKLMSRKFRQTSGLLVDFLNK